jgi:hypothetical protein
MNYKILKLPEVGKWIPYNQVIYYEEGYRKEINKNLLKQYAQLSEKAFNNNVLFLYLPGLAAELKNMNTQLLETLRYNHPEWSSRQIDAWIKDFQDFISHIDYGKFSDTIGWAAFTFQAPDPVHLIRRLDENNIVVWGYHSFINDKSEVNIPDECFLSPIDFNKKFINDYVLFNIADGPFVYDVDDWFENDGDRISREIRERITILSKQGLYGSLIETFLYAAKECGIEIKPEIAAHELTSAQLNAHKDPRNKMGVRLPKPKKKVLKWDNYPELSSLRIDEHFKIILPKYNNVEIKLTPLPKALYILFLKHPEGILLKQLIDYKAELLSIYNKLSNRSEQAKIDDSIEAMLDPTNNSVNEKCSRIKEAFLKEMDDTIAKNYYITGERGQPKRIILSRSLVYLPF